MAAAVDRVDQAMYTPRSCTPAWELPWKSRCREMSAGRPLPLVFFRLGRSLNALQRNHFGQFEEGHAQFKQDRIQHALLDGGKVTLRLFFNHAEQVDALTRTND